MGTVQDTAGNSSQDSIAVIVSNADIAPPTVTISSPQNGEVINRNTTTVTVTATDNVGVTSVSLYQDGKLLATDFAPPYLFSWNAKKAGNGRHILQAVARDAAGNLSYSANVSVICK